MSREERLTNYFLTRAIEMLEAAKAEKDEERRCNLEQRCAGYWKIAKTGGDPD